MGGSRYLTRAGRSTLTIIVVTLNGGIIPALPPQSAPTLTRVTLTANLTDSTEPGLLRAAAGAGALAVTALWAAQIEPGQSFIQVAAHFAGLQAEYGVLIALLLMARVPAVERGVGADRLARWHAHCGRATVALIAAHACLALWRAVTGGGGMTPAAALTALLGAALFFTAGVVSARAVRRRVTHEVWHRVHLLLYLAAALGFHHQPGGSDLRHPVPAACWLVAHGCVAGLLLWFRVVTPIRAALRHELRVIRIENEAPGVFSVYLFGTDLDHLRAEPGQFFRWRFLSRGSGARRCRSRCRRRSRATSCASR